MKIQSAHYQHLHLHISNALHRAADKHGKSIIELLAYHRAAIVASKQAKDIDKRIRWDVLHLAQLSNWICDNLYTYLNDDHIDTALRHIVAELKL